VHQRNPIVNIPLLIGIVLSVALHGAMLYSKGIYTLPTPMMEQGKTVVHLTLIPSIARPAAAPEPPIEKPIEQPIEEVIEEAVLVSVEKRVEQPPDPPPEPEPEHIAETPEKASEEQDASLIEEKGVIAEAQPLKAVSPTYPRMSRRHGEEGTVSLSIEVLKSGKAGTVSVVRSSGHKRLDKAALRAAKKTTFIPATQFGKKIDSIMTYSYTFIFEDES
jgi:protein TonB